MRVYLKMNVHQKTKLWDQAVVSTLNSDTLLGLINNEVSLICLDDFATSDECEAVAQQACIHGFDPYDGVEPRITRIGSTVFEYNSRSHDAYFDDVEKKRPVQEKIFAESWDPVSRLIELIRANTGLPVDVAKDSSGRSYYAGLVRRIEGGTLLHIDYAPIEHEDWSVCDVTAQLSWNLYLRLSDRTAGHTHIYERQWLPKDMEHREGGYGFDHSVVEGSAKVTLRPKVGQLAIFNTKNYHEVESTRGERITATSAIGMMPGGNLVLWS